MEDSCPMYARYVPALTRCQTCIDRLYTAGQAPCPVCKQTLRKSNFVAQTFEDLLVEKEMQIRRKVGKYFNKRIEDFNGNLKAYNDYLEEVENLLFNLVNDIDIQKTTERIELFRAENKEIIAKNVAKEINDQKFMAYKVEKEKREKALRKEQFEMAYEQESMDKKAQKEDVITQLAFSEKSPDEIIKESIQKRNMLAKINLPIIETEIVDEEDMMDYGIDYDPLADVVDEHEVLNSLLKESYDDPLTAQVKNDKIARAGGYQVEFTYKKALLAAFSGIFLNMNKET